MLLHSVPISGGLSLMVYCMAKRQRIPKNTHRRTLLKKRDELLAASRIESRMVIILSRSPDTFEFASHVVEQEVAACLVNLRFQTLQDVDDALGRIQKGGFGICEMCDEPISHNRLKAIPWARFCFDCQDPHGASRN